VNKLFLPLHTGISNCFFNILLKLAIDAQSSDQFIWALVSFENF